MDQAFLKKLRILGHIEGVSTLVLFCVAMPLKYKFGMPMAVSVAGSVHGFLFMALAAANWIAIERVPIGTRLGVAGVIGAVVPFGPFVVDRWLKALGEGGEQAAVPEPSPDHSPS